MTACHICKTTENILTVCLGCVRQNDFNELAIFTSIRNSKYGLTITQIALRTGIHRNTIRSRLNGLETKGLIMSKYYGSTRLCQIPPGGEGNDWTSK